MDLRQKAGRLAGIALAVLVLAVALILWLENRRIATIPPSDTTQEVVDSDGVPGPNALADIQHPADVPPQAAPADVTEKTDTSTQQEVQLTVKFIGSDGTPMPLVDFNHCVLELGDYLKRTRQGEALPLKTETADASGSLNLTAPASGILYVSLLDDTFVCDKRWGIKTFGMQNLRAFPPNATAGRLTNEPEQTIEIVLLKQGEVSLQIEYADGEQFIGRFKYAFVNDRGDLISRRFRSAEYKPGATLQVQEAANLRITVEGPRAGFKRFTSVDLTNQDLSGGLARVVIPEDPNRFAPCGLILDHSGFSQDQKLMARLVSNTGGRRGAEVLLSGPGKTRTDEMGAPGFIECIGVGDGVVWTSGLLRVEAGEWKEVAVVPVKAACLKLQVRDENGDPIKGAVVSTERAGHINWLVVGSEIREQPTGGLVVPKSKRDLSIAHRQMRRCRSDADGNVMFRYTWPGNQKFIVDALGYESAIFEINLAEGREHDHGVVTLPAATATVKVKGLPAEGLNPEDLDVLLWIPFGGMGHGEYVPMDAQGEATISKVPSGRYQVMIFKRNKGEGGWSRMIDLARGDTVQVLIDLSQPYGVQED